MSDAPVISRLVVIVTLFLISSAAVGCVAPPAAAPFDSPQPPTTEATMSPTDDGRPLLLTPRATATPAPPQPSGPREITPTAPAARLTLLDLTVADLAGRLSLAADAITVRQVVEVEWPDASLGCPQPGMMYAQVITPGQRIVLEADGRTYEYHAGEGRFILCRP